MAGLGRRIVMFELSGATSSTSSAGVTSATTVRPNENRAIAKVVVVVMALTRLGPFEAVVSTTPKSAESKKPESEHKAHATKWQRCIGGVLSGTDVGVAQIPGTPEAGVGWE